MISFLDESKGPVIDYQGEIGAYFRELYLILSLLGGHA